MSGDKGCYRQLSFSGLGHAPALALIGVTSECSVIRSECLAASCFVDKYWRRGRSYFLERRIWTTVSSLRLLLVGGIYQRFSVR